VKLDGDVSFESDYFKRCLDKFEHSPHIGIAGGVVMVSRNGTLSVECPSDPAFHVRGATKIYRRECWDAIGGIPAFTGWDTIDELKANMLGWRTVTFPDLTLVHHRKTGAAYGTWRDSLKNGRANYIAGYHPLFMLCKCLRRGLIAGRPLPALGLLAGFLQGYCSGMQRVADAHLIRYVRNQQLQFLALRPSIWRTRSADTK
jgi:hypothetical protein